MVSYIDFVEKVDTEKLQGFFEGWPNPPSRERFLQVLRNSNCVVLAVDDATGHVVGFITAISDGVLILQR